MLTMDNTKATEYLEHLLNKKLRVHTNDKRMFIGDFKCTDNVVKSFSTFCVRDKQLTLLRSVTLSSLNPTNIVPQQKVLSEPQRKHLLTLGRP